MNNKSKEPNEIQKLAMNLMLKLNELDSPKMLLWTCEMSDNEIRLIKLDSRKPFLQVIKQGKL